MRPSGSPEVLETRRRIAARLFERGMTLTEVAAAVGASVSSAHRWREAWRHGDKLHARPHPGRKPKLSAHQRSELVAALKQGTRHWGYAPSGWTGPLVRDMIQRLFDVEYHPTYVPRLLHQLGHEKVDKSKGSGLIDVSLALNTEYRGRDRRYRRPPAQIRT